MAGNEDKKQEPVKQKTAKQEPEKQEPVLKVIDADGLMLGRMASITAKRLLNGETLVIVNAERALVSGNRATTINHYLHKRSIGTKDWGPFFPKRPDRLVKRTIRGMVPHKRERGREALSNLRVYIGVPEEYAKTKKETLDDASYKRLSNIRYTSLDELCRRLGANY
jgi:large subunit ribosomal protein L13